MTQWLDLKVETFGMSLIIPLQIDSVKESTACTKLQDPKIGTCSLKLRTLAATFIWTKSNGILAAISKGAHIFEYFCEILNFEASTRYLLKRPTCWPPTDSPVGFRQEAACLGNVEIQPFRSSGVTIVNDKPSIICQQNKHHSPKRSIHWGSPQVSHHYGHIVGNLPFGARLQSHGSLAAISIKETLRPNCTIKDQICQSTKQRQPEMSKWCRHCRDTYLLYVQAKHVS